MVEQTMFFALGFLVAGFIAVLLTPALNQRAERLANRRMRALFPVSLEEMTAERDHLRAEFAVTTRSLERKHERLIDEKAIALSDVGKQVSFVSGLKRQFDEARGKLSSLEAAHADLKTDLDSAHKKYDAAAAARDEALDGIKTLRSRNEQLAREQDEAVARVDRQRMAIAELEDRVSAISTAAGDSKAKASLLSDELLAERNTVHTLQETLGNHRANAARLTARITALEKARDAPPGAAWESENVAAEIRALRERLARAQEENQVLRQQLAAQAEVSPSHSTDDVIDNKASPIAADKLRDSIASLQVDMLQLKSSDTPVEAAALRQRIAVVAQSIMARPADTPEMETAPMRVPARRKTRASTVQEDSDSRAQGKS